MITRTLCLLPSYATDTQSMRTWQTIGTGKECSNVQLIPLLFWFVDIRDSIKIRGYSDFMGWHFLYIKTEYANRSELQSLLCTRERSSFWFMIFTVEKTLGYNSQLQVYLIQRTWSPCMKRVGVHIKGTIVYKWVNFTISLLRDLMQFNSSFDGCAFIGLHSVKPRIELPSVYHCPWGSFVNTFEHNYQVRLQFEF